LRFIVISWFLQPNRNNREAGRKNSRAEREIAKRLVSLFRRKNCSMEGEYRKLTGLLRLSDFVCNNVLRVFIYTKYDALGLAVPR
jgi:hypothetical protein